MLSTMLSTETVDKTPSNYKPHHPLEPLGDMIEKTMPTVKFSGFSTERLVTGISPGHGDRTSHRPRVAGRRSTGARGRSGTTGAWYRDRTGASGVVQATNPAPPGSSPVVVRVNQIRRIR